MSSPLDSVLSRALSIRLNLQISLSSLPFVEEWMDVHLNRWMESVPLPPEMPMGHTASFSVLLASDLSRMAWRAHGHPTGFIPKMTKYFESCRMTNQDVVLLDHMGNTLEPRLVGSWVSVIGEQIETGWQFSDAHPFATIEPLFADHDAKAKLLSWLEHVRIDKFQRFSQSISDHAFSELEFRIPGVSVDDQLSSAQIAFQMLLGQELPKPVVQSMNEALSPEFSIGVRIHDGQITKLALISPGLGNDVIAELCKASDLTFHKKMHKLQGALGNDGTDQVEYYTLLSDGQWTTSVDLHIIPSDSTPLPISGLN